MNKKNDPRGSIVVNIFRANILLERVGHSLSSQAGLTSLHQWFILAALSRSGDLSFKELRNNMLVTKQNMTGMIDRLRQNGLVTTLEAPEDRRVTLARITEKGKQALLDANEYGNESNESSFHSFTKQEIEAFNSYLERLITNLKKEK
ncbi:MarR family transcriptional regulator [Paenibacillus sp. sptzw28]|uniref:MarR family winged helix-turn-helix transcriptional regulator n=1 Tax=Paenibacillus sp. sptzw28 TaxID=715179 RepID=UPI001C6E564F|nr:MarR family transcriptional regulator [Paenibacillus sp. sptzw28]QYR20192.1 MarR family transcriptional regulator [Paenibacillus sp. sptzw28]